MNKIVRSNLRVRLGDVILSSLLTNALTSNTESVCISCLLIILLKVLLETSLMLTYNIQRFSVRVYQLRGRMKKGWLMLVMMMLVMSGNRWLRFENLLLRHPSTTMQVNLCEATKGIQNLLDPERLIWRTVANETGAFFLLMDQRSCRNWLVRVRATA
ncbi:hypothetical protein Bca4012_029464 [Brassica carinata]